MKRFFVLMLTFCVVFISCTNNTPYILTEEQIKNYCTQEDQKADPYQEFMDNYDLVVQYEEGQNWDRNKHMGFGMTVDAFVSPDKRNLAYSSTKGNVVVLDLQTREFRSLTNPPSGFRDGTGAWSPDGEAFVFRRYNQQSTSLFIVNSDGSNERRLTNPAENQYDSRVFFLPNEFQILFVRSTRTPDATGFFSNDGLFVIESNGSNLRRLDMSDDQQIGEITLKGNQIAVFVKSKKQHFTNYSSSNLAWGDQDEQDKLQDLYLITNETQSKLLTVFGIGVGGLFWTNDGRYIGYTNSGLTNHGSFLISTNSQLQVKCP